jgi:hypothetical protein
VAPDTTLQLAVNELVLMLVAALAVGATGGGAVIFIFNCASGEPMSRNTNVSDPTVFQVILA